ncbi:MAG: DUF6785 family protein, partial [Armatimonadota bacterium]|nr:DUF6785 family protein [Armatimonadota bacterium]
MAVSEPKQARTRTAAEPELSAEALAAVWALAIAFCAAVPWLVYVHRTGDPAAGYLPPGPLALLAILCWAVAPLVRRWLGSAERLVRAGLLFYALTVSLGGFATTFTVLQIPQIIPSLRYFATAANRFEDEAIPAVADTLIITNEVAARGFFEGGRTPGIPWDLWLGPLVRWGVLAFLYLVTAIGMLGIFRTRWIEHERLPFPLAEIPLFVAGHGHFGMAEARPRRNRLLLIGMLASGLVYSINALHEWVPSVPAIPRNFSLTLLFESSPWNILAGTSWSRAWIDLPLIGIAYLMPSAIALGIFGFFLLMVGIMVLSRFLGDPTLGPLRWRRWGSQKDIQAGAYVGLLAFVFWSAREQIGGMVRDLWRDISARGSGSRHPDRFMLVAFVLGLLAICWWCVSAGISLPVALSFMLATLALTFGFALLTAQSGLPSLQVDNLPAQFLTAFVPARDIGLRNMALIGFFNTMFSWYKRHAVQPAAIHGLKIADAERVPDRRFITALLTAGALLIGVNSVTLLHLAYNESLMLSTTTRWHQHAGGMGSPYYGVLWAMRMIDQPDPALSFHWMLLGGGLMWALQLLYRHVMWWPVHPLGMLIPCGWQITAQWFSVMIGWAVGRAATKYAGPRSYLGLRPLFLGLVLGGALAQALW